jgi:glycerophosphoryl diester phosphodiesterase
MRLSLFGLIDRWLAPAPDPARLAWLGGVTYAHRGLHGPGQPENAPSAFAAAIARGLGIECDIQRARDGQAMVFHDYALDRLTGAAGLVADHTADQLQRITLTGSDDTIPTLDQFLAQVAGTVPLLIEIKTVHGASHHPVCRAVAAALAGYSGHHAVMSFDVRIVRWFARHSPMTVRGLVVTEEADRGVIGNLRRHGALWFARAEFLAYDIRDLPSRFAAAQRRRGVPVLTWTVRSATLRERARHYADAPIAEAAGIP